MKLIFNELVKNLRLIVRNWGSLALLIIAPLVLILLVGYAFSGSGLHDIRVGVVADNSLDTKDFAQNVSGFAKIVNYPTLDPCINAMKKGSIHVCLEIHGQLDGAQGVPSGDITFYYDNTRKKTSLLVLNSVREYFGITSERISLISTQRVIDSMQELLLYVSDGVKDLAVVEEQAAIVRADLVVREQKLVDFQGKFEPQYKHIKELQGVIHNTSALSIDQTQESIIILENVRNVLLEAGNGTNETAFNKSLSLLDAQLLILRKDKDQQSSTLATLTAALDQMVAELDMFNALLYDEIMRTRDSIELLDKSVLQIKQTREEAEKKLGGLGDVDSGLANRLVNPISQQFEELLPGVKEIQLAFPSLLVMVIIFISLLFSTVLTMLELHNRAYTRNILAPVHYLLYAGGLLLTTSLLILLQIGVLLLVAQFVFTLPIASHFIAVGFISILLMVLFSLLGMIIAYQIDTIQTATLLSIFVALGYFLLSDALNALEAMPVFAAAIAQFNPLVLATNALRKVLFFDLPLGAYVGELAMLGLYLVVAVAVLLVIAKKRNQKRL